MPAGCSLTFTSTVSSACAAVRSSAQHCASTLCSLSSLPHPSPCNTDNWDGPLSWQQLAARICGTTATNSEWGQFTASGLPVAIGEWSLSTNLGAGAFTDLSNATVRARLRTLYANQMSLFSSAALGQFHWALRMGSGWDPRPTPAAPGGAQAPGSAWDSSLPGFWPAVWSLGELARLGVAVPLQQLQVTGVCQCKGCSASG
jgi:hypothetical protein